MLISRQIGSGVVVLECSDAFSELAGSVFDMFEQLDRTGPPLKDGSRIQLGFSELTLRAEDNKLRVCEPDFSGDISQIRANIDITLSVLKEQVSALHAAGEEGTDVLFTDWVAVSRGAIEAPNVFLKRDLPLSKVDSGWFIGRLEDLEAAKPAEEVDAKHVYEVLRMRPRLVDVMTLPVGYLVIIRGQRVQAMLDRDLRIRWGKYPE
jgi:hypothetical protein